MDGHRFDRLAKALSRWTSRRRFLAGLAGGIGGSLAATGAMAQGTPTSDLGQQIAARAEEALARLPPPEVFGEQQFDQRLPEFVAALRDLAERVLQDAPTWTEEQIEQFRMVTEFIPLAVSAGVDSYLERWAGEALQTQLDAPASAASPQDPSPIGGGEFVGDVPPPQKDAVCTATCLEVWDARKGTCGDDIACLADYFFRFVECLLAFGTDDSVCLANLIPNGCLVQAMCACRVDCL